MSGTRKLVFRQWLALLLLTLLTAAGAVTAIETGRGDAEALYAGEAPAREGLAAAEESLITADAEAISRFADQHDAALRGGDATAQLPGPGPTYRAAIIAAGTQLARVSQADVGGRAAESVQVVTGLLNTYTGLIEDAFRDDAGALLSQAYLKYAHLFLTEEILGQLALLRIDVDDAVGDRPPAGRHLLWILPLIMLAGLLVWTQLEVSRRFGRTLSIPLLAASLALAGLAVTGGFAVHTDRQVAGGRVTLTDLKAAYTNRQNTIRKKGCVKLGTVSQLWSASAPPCRNPTLPPSADGRKLLDTANDVSTTAQHAAASARNDTAVAVVLTGLTLLLITLGLLPRIEEYRFRRR